LSPKSESIFKTKFAESCAIVLGTEDEGLSQFWVENSDFSVMVPMAGIADSFNVSVAAGVLLFEVMRQRKI
jgi:TrmH family RNA methyltransferase